MVLPPDVTQFVDWALHASIIVLWFSSLESAPQAVVCGALVVAHYGVSAGWRWQLAAAYLGLALAALGWATSAVILSVVGIGIGILFPVPLIDGIAGEHDVGFVDYEVRCGSVYVVRCTLHSARCILHAAFCTLHSARCT
jgi:hypothetical protein